MDARAYWFNDMDYHGVLADPFFRYSVRVDGVFAPGFVETLRDTVTRGDGRTSTGTLTAWSSVAPAWRLT